MIETETGEPFQAIQPICVFKNAGSFKKEVLFLNGITDTSAIIIN